MLCENCGKNEANVKYTQIINGVKKQMALCEKCAQDLGIEDINFNMPINFSNFLGDFFGEYENNSLLPNLLVTKQLKCPKCNMNYDEFLKLGKFGCDQCYETFKERIDPIIKNIHGASTHTGRIGKFLNKENQENKIETGTNDESKLDKNYEINNSKQEDKNSINEKNKLEELKRRLKQEIKEEKYENAAKTRDEIKKIENN